MRWTVMVDPDDVLTAEERKLLKKAEGQMRRGKYVRLAGLEHELDRQRDHADGFLKWV